MSSLNFRKKFDFYDFGSYRGGSFRLAQSFGARNGLGFEINKNRVLRLAKAGIPCMQLDVTKVSLPKNSANFIVMCHFLEHLDNEQQVFETLKKSIEAATDFIYIEGPSFDFDDYLKSLGFKFFWYDGCGHKTRVTVKMLRRIFVKLGIKDISCFAEQPYVKDSKSDDIYPYDSGIHNTYCDKSFKKETVTFKKDVYRSFVMFAWLRKGVNKSKYTLTKRIKNKFNMRIEL